MEKLVRVSPLSDYEFKVSLRYVYKPTDFADTKRLSDEARRIYESAKSLLLSLLSDRSVYTALRLIIGKFSRADITSDLGYVVIGSLRKTSLHIDEALPSIIENKLRSIAERTSAQIARLEAEASSIRKRLEHMGTGFLASIKRAILENSLHKIERKITELKSLLETVKDLLEKRVWEKFSEFVSRIERLRKRLEEVEHEIMEKLSRHANELEKIVPRTIEVSGYALNLSSIVVSPLSKAIEITYEGVVRAPDIAEAKLLVKNASPQDIRLVTVKR